MSRARYLSVLVVTILWLVAVSNAAAQSFLQRLAEQLDTSTARERPAVTGELPPPEPATAAPGTLGLRVAPVTEESVRAYRLTVRRGALITAIEKGSPADVAKLPLGAVIVALDGRRVDSPEDMMAALRPLRAGQQVDVTYYEHDRLARKKIALGTGAAPALVPVPDSARSVPPPPSPITSVPPPRSADRLPVLPSLGAEPGGSGGRPLLNRLGRILENVVAPAQAIEPAPPLEPNPVLPNVESPTLQRQVEELRRQVELLQRQVDSLERKLNDRR